MLDANILIALAFTDHVHHRAATNWFGGLRPSFATCPITQAALVRFAIRNGAGGTYCARQLLKAIVSMDGHLFWPDDIDCDSLPWAQIFGYRQVTEAYLVALAKHHGGRLATLDQALSTVFTDTVLVPVAPIDAA